MAKINYEFVNSQFEARGYILISKEYKSSHGQLEYICPKHEKEGILKITWSNFNKPSGCRHCAHEKNGNNKRLPFDKIKELFDSLNYTLLSKEYKSNSTPLEYICNKHVEKGVQKMRYGNLQQGKRCYFCSKERVAEDMYIPYEEVKKILESKGLALISEEYNGIFDTLKYRCNNIPEQIQESTFQTIKNRKYCCKICFDENRFGENSPQWKGGTSLLNKYLREKIGQWKMDSMKAYGFKCALTGDSEFEIHHIHSFSNILKETLEELNMPILSSISKYAPDDLQLIEQHFLKNNYKYGLGILLSPSLHNEFHNIYGRGNNTYEQFEEFLLSKGFSIDILIENELMAS